jgi:NitT/TauT family transport system ATP-binding protein
LTDAGKQIAKADILTCKSIFAKHLLAYVPLIQYIHQTLKESSNHRIAKKHFITKLEAFFNDEDAQKILKIMIQWGRYAELFAYDDKNEELNLENPT